MKVKISFELDLEGTPFNIDNLDELRGSFQNISSWLNHLHFYHQEQLMETWEQCDEVLRQEMHNKCKIDTDLSSQLFNNYTISGITDDGHSFEHNHQEPGYKETMIIDGKEVDDY